jgi:hypothetical protein
MDFDGIFVSEVDWRKWGWHLLFDIFTTIPYLQALAPTFPWTHNNNEAITICDKICNMEMVGMFYLVSWYERFLKLHTFSRGTNIPLIHPLHGTTKRTYKLWLSKGFNNWQWHTVHTMMQEEGPMLFASGVGSLKGEGWQVKTYEIF